MTINDAINNVASAKVTLAEALVAKYGVQEEDIVDASGNTTSEGLYRVNKDNTTTLRPLSEWAALLTASNVYTTNSISFLDASNTKVSFNGSSSLDLTGGIYYAVTSGTADVAKSVAWANTGHPSTFTPKAHAHGSISNEGTLMNSANYVVITDENSKITAEQYLATSRGGTGLGSFTLYGIFYASNANTIAQITAASSTNAGKVLAINSAGTGYEWVSKSNNTGTVTSITPGTGLSNGTDTSAITTSGTLNLITATNTVIGGVKIGNTLTNTTGYTACPIKDGVIYYKDETHTNDTYTGTVTSITIGTTNYTPSSGTVTLPNYPTNADTVDGWHASNSIRGGQWAEFIPVIDSSGDLNIGPTLYFHDVDNGYDFYFMASTAGLSTSGRLFNNSDIRFKSIVEYINPTTSEFASLPMFTYTWKNRADSNLEVGSSALAVEEVIPELVSGTDFKSLDYATLGAIASITACREIEKLKERIKELEDKLNG